MKGAHLVIFHKNKMNVWYISFNQGKIIQENKIFYFPDDVLSLAKKIFNSSKCPLKHLSLKKA